MIFMSNVIFFGLSGKILFTTAIVLRAKKAHRSLKKRASASINCLISKRVIMNTAKGLEPWVFNDHFEVIEGAVGAKRHDQLKGPGPAISRRLRSGTHPTPGTPRNPCPEAKCIPRRARPETHSPKRNASHAGRAQKPIPRSGTHPTPGTPRNACPKVKCLSRRARPETHPPKRNASHAGRAQKPIPRSGTHPTPGTPRNACPKVKCLSRRARPETHPPKRNASHAGRTQKRMPRSEIPPTPDTPRNACPEA